MISFFLEVITSVDVKRSLWIYKNLTDQLQKTVRTRKRRETPLTHIVIRTDKIESPNRWTLIDNTVLQELKKIR